MFPYLGQSQANYGTLTTLDTLAASQQNIAQFGEDRAWEAIDMALMAHNMIVSEMVTDFVEVTTDRLRRFGNTAQMRMVEVDEFGTADAQKIIAGVTVGFPLRLYSIAIQWTKKYFQTMKANELAAQFTSCLDADVLRVITVIKQALFNPFNYLSEDRFVDHLQAIQLPIKGLVNADGLGLPPGPNGEVFDGTTHNHYLTCATPGAPAQGDFLAQVNTVVEHFGTGHPMLYIARADEQTIRGLSGFTPYLDARLLPMIANTGTNAYANQGVTPYLDPVQIYNRAIGILNGAEVWVKPWMIAGYSFCWVKGQPVPLCMRVRDASTNALVLASEIEEHPLRARQFEREFGVGVWNRVNGAVLDYTHSIYTAPPIS